MDFAQLQWRARRLAGLEVTGARHDPMDVAEAVNDAHAELVGLEQWGFLYESATIPVVAGTAVYVLPDPLRMVAHVALGGKTLVPRAPHIAHDLGRARGEYELLGQTDIHVRPTPATAGELTVHGWRAPTVLAAAGDVPMLPAEFHRTIAYLAALGLLSQAPRIDEDDPRVQTYGRLVASDVERLRDQDQRQHDTTPSYIGARRLGRR